MKYEKLQVPQTDVTTRGENRPFSSHISSSLAIELKIWENSYQTQEDCFKKGNIPHICRNLYLLFDEVALSL